MEEENGKATRYYVDMEGCGERHRSVSVLIAGRRCFTCQQSLTDDMVLKSDPQEHLEQIVSQCSLTPDYLLPDTPIKEAIFRVILAGGNEPKTPDEISEFLTEKWALSVYPRNVSPAVVGKLLDHSESYCIVSLPEPEVEAEVDEEGESEPEPEIGAAVE